MNHNRLLGYTKDEKGEFVVDPDESEVVRRIFREYLEGVSFQKISRGLESEGILTGFGKTKWRAETLQKNVESVLARADGILLCEIDIRLEELQKELLKIVNFKCNYDSISDEIYHLREKKCPGGQRRVKHETTNR